LTRRFEPEPELLQLLVEHVQLSGSSGANSGTKSVDPVPEEGAASFTS
jgi:hypothetical protein